MFLVLQHIEVRGVQIEKKLGCLAAFAKSCNFFMAGSMACIQDYFCEPSDAKSRQYLKEYFTTKMMPNFKKRLQSFLSLININDASLGCKRRLHNLVGFLWFTDVFHEYWS
jgi:hypothetical protein